MESRSSIIKMAEKQKFLWFWFKETRKELCSLRSSVVLSRAFKIFVWIMMFTLSFVCLNLLVYILSSESTFIEKILRCINVVVTFFSLTFMFLGTFIRYIRAQALRGVITKSVSDALERVGKKEM